MTNDELQKLAASPGDCGKALLKISEVMAVKEYNPTVSEAKSEKLEKPLTLEAVRKVTSDKAHKGFTAEVRNLIQKYGADKLSGIDAALSASSCYRWLACMLSAKECAKFPDTSSEFARQGTDAHTLCEFKVKTALGQKLEDPTKGLTFFDEEMAQCTDGYAQFVMECMATAKASCKDPLIMIEQRLDFSKWVPGGFGTGDCLIVADDTLTVIDYKHGLGVLVDAERNPQMMCYALGALNLFDGIYDICQVSMTIFQPRRDNVSTCTMSKDELLRWGETVLKPAAELATKGKGEYKAGDHCRLATCRKRAEYNLELARGCQGIRFAAGSFRQAVGRMETGRRPVETPLRK